METKQQTRKGISVVVGYFAKDGTPIHDEFTVKTSQELNNWLDNNEKHGSTEVHFFC